MRRFVFGLSDWRFVRRGRLIERPGRRPWVRVVWPLSGEELGAFEPTPENFGLCKELVRNGFKLEFEEER
ncbi:MAG TPA: hypothetical protein VNA25_30405 [Phycisphaerae bacterium]|nr:hypothetical protein [Phycisphaerae bacterium]